MLRPLLVFLTTALVLWPSALRAGQTTDLLNAAARGDTAAVKTLLQSGADPNGRSPDGASASLIEVGRAGSIVRNRHGGATALILAAERGHADVVALLLESGAQVDGTDSDGRTALMAASREGHENIVTLLIARRANVNATSAGSSIDQLVYEDYPNRFVVKLATMNALEQAVQGAHLPIVRRLIDGGADVNAKHPVTGWTSLMTVCLAGQTLSPIITALLDAGADATLKSTDGKSAYSVALERSTPTTLTMMLMRADPRSVLDGGLSPLQLAAREGLDLAVREQLKKGADPNAKTPAGETPLTLVRRGKKDALTKGRKEMWTNAERALSQAGARK